MSDESSSSDDSTSNFLAKYEYAVAVIEIVLMSILLIISGSFLVQSCRQ